MRSVTILGATGSVGRRTLEVLADSGQAYTIRALSAGHDAQSLAKLALAARPSMVHIADESRYIELKSYLQDTNIHVCAGASGEAEICNTGVDWVMAAISGYACYRPLMRIMQHANVIALANKEALVCAGDTVMRAADYHQCRIIPVDSEHASLFRLMNGQQQHAVSSATLTASGGAFRDIPADRLTHMRPKDALCHPVWDMGAKITVDSATMMNKGLEIIEAHRLFPFLAQGSVDAIIHTQSLIHAFIHWTDGTSTAHCFGADMGFPIAQAWAYPDIAAHAPAPSTAWMPSAATTMSFSEVEPQKYPCFFLALEALRSGGAAPMILNIANEEAVGEFLKEHILFTDIASRVEHALEQYGRESFDGNDLDEHVRDIKRRIKADR